MSLSNDNDGQAISSYPHNVVVVLLDSLNRHLLGAYGSREFATPNLDRLAARSTVFTRHYSGSLPCIPARHDILCGALDFLWKPWGSIEVWEEPITRQLARAGVTTALITDHPHLFESGGENFHTDFGAWEYLRGHESDPWKTRADPSWIGTPALPAAPAVPAKQYDTSRTWFYGEEDFPGPRTMGAAARWLASQRPATERFLMFVDEFDPHEPFDTPEPWASLYDPLWKGPRLIWPPYSKATISSGVLSEREADHIRANYGAKLSMIDYWIGKVLDVMDSENLWTTTAFILCSDHGHYLGERDLFGKPLAPIFDELGHVPLMISWPGVEPCNIDALTTSVDLHATLSEVFGVSAHHRTHGRSLVPLLRGSAVAVRDYLLTGYWGREVFLVYDNYKYGRAPADDNFPLSMWSNRWSTMPRPGSPHDLLPPPDRRSYLDYMPGATSPVIRQPFEPGDKMPFHAYNVEPGAHVLYNLRDDPGEIRNLAGGPGLSPIEQEAVEALRAALVEIEAPGDQLVRLGLERPPKP
ncbi:MAG: sulfatase [Actinobacteria bacterium]|nr:sulfatase [Actinomycetota bacterium]